MLSSYQQWLESINVEAPKAHIEAQDDGQRGLFASHDIFAGERILHLPSRALLSEERLRTQGASILETREGNVELSKEQLVVGMIEELHQLMHGTDDTSMVQMTARSIQYQWRGDDTVALYLIACRKLVKQQSESAVVEESSSAEESMIEQVVDAPAAEAEPILVHNVVPVAVQDSLEDEPLQQPATNDEEDTVAVEQDEVSFCSFLPHVVMLPDSFPTNPLYFTDEELSGVEGTNCYEFTKRMLVQMESDWMQLSAVLRAYLVMDDRRIPSAQDDYWNPDEDFEHYKWALNAIYSRSTDFFINQDHRRVIAPLFDMMNHEFASNVTHAMDQNGNLSVFAGSDIPAGSEIFLRYGDFPNEKMLSVYGFVVPFNPYDAVQIYAPIPSADPLFAIKAQILKSKCGVLDPNAPHALRLNEPIPESLLCTLRLVGLQSEEDLELAASSSESFAGVVSRENEYNALMALSQALHTMARRLALNMISDENLQAANSNNDVINSGDPPVVDQHESSKTISNLNIAHCKILCQSEYLILQSALEELSTRLELLENPELDITSQ